MEPIKYTYNAKGLITKSVQGTRIFKFIYNARGQLSGRTNPLGEIERFTYNLDGQLRTHTVANGDIYSFTYNPNGMLRNITMPDDRLYRNSYNVNSYQASFREPMIDDIDYLWRWHYNFDNDITRYTLPDASRISYSYDSQGRLQSQVGPNFQRNYTYSSKGLLTGIQWSSSDSLAIDSDERRLKSVAWAGEVKGTLSYGWDATARLKTLALNGQNLATYSYLPEGEVAKVNDLNISRRADTGMVSSTSIQSVKTDQTYNSFGELASLSATIGTNEAISYTLDRDTLGRISRILTRTGSTQTERQFSFDAKGQLVSEIQNGITTSYSYTKSGNRLTPGGEEVHDSQDRLVSDAKWTYVYSRNGQLERKTSKMDGGSVIFDYDAAGNLRSVQKADGTVVQYKADGLDRRISRSVNEAFDFGLLYQDDLRPIAQVDQAGNVLATFIYASRSNSPDLVIRGSETYRIVHDHLGSVLFVVNTATGSIAQSLTYDTWGNVVSDSNPGFQPFGFAGGLYDSTTGLVRFGARDYDPTIGRWLNKDPIRFYGSWNLYGYVGNDPVNFVDPDGLKTTFANQTAENLYNAMKANISKSEGLSKILNKIESNNNAFIQPTPDRDFSNPLGEQSDSYCSGSKDNQMIVIKDSASSDSSDIANQALLFHELLHSFQLSRGDTGRLSEKFPNKLQIDYLKMFGGRK